MGRKRGSKFGKNIHKKKQKRDDRDDKDVWRPALVYENEKFTNYYKAQNIMPPEEWDLFIETMKTSLPVTFRVTGSKAIGEEVKKSLENFMARGPIKVNDQVIDPPKPMDWYPQPKGAWYFKSSRKELRKLPEFEQLFTFINAQNAFGNISRQEAVSMVPPLFLDVQPHHYALDMCAAPGSKTAQIIEMLHSKGDLVPSGMVIANDADHTRCYTLCHQIKRLNSPCCVVTNHEAQFFPTLKDIRFDRILCDVPCTGDGTLRKSPEIWGKWSNMNAMNLHKIQKAILYRASLLLKVGGRLVYSTCSLNPLENEAVVAFMIRKSNGAMRLIDVSNEITALKRNPGLTTWKYIDANGKEYPTFESIPVDPKRRYAPSFFPPTPKEVEEMNLTRCMRFLPHHQDTGGFFVAVFEKVSNFTQMEDDEANKQSAKKEESATTVESTEQQADKPVTVPTEEKKQRAKKRGEDPFYLLSEKPQLHSIWNDVCKFYGIQNLPLDQVLIRTENTPSKFYFTNKAVSSLLAADERDKLVIINMGVRLIMKHDTKVESPCNYRISQDGVYQIIPYANDKRIITVAEDDLRVLLKDKSTYATLFTPSVQAALNNIETGCVICLVDPKSDSKTAGTAVACWKGRLSCHMLLAREEMDALKNLLGIEVERIKGKPKNQNDKESKQEEEDVPKVEDDENDNTKPKDDNEVDDEDGEREENEDNDQQDPMNE